jgi:hypothetical protein
MQPTPFSGLLTTIHLTVVVFSKVFYFFFPKRLQYIPRANNKFIEGVICAGIILTILCFSLISAFYVIRASLKEDGSTVKIAETYYQAAVVHPKK